MLKQTMIALTSAVAIGVGFAGSADALTIGFESILPSGDSNYVYQEGGFNFSGSISAFGSANVALRPVGSCIGDSPTVSTNGTTTALACANGGWINMAKTDGGLFNLLSIDIGELLSSGMSSGSRSYTLKGLLANGSEITRLLNTDGITGTQGFETVNLNLLGFTGLQKFSVSAAGFSPYIHIDNIKTGPATPVPTPAAVLPGLIGMGAAALRKKGEKEELVEQEA